MKKTINSQTNHSQTERGLRELRSRIIAGHWPAGSKLREVPLSESLGVSRTPLRAALLKLEQEGLVERSGAGYTVRGFSLEDAYVAIELRGVIEGTAARTAAERGVTTAELVAIKQTVAAIDTILEQDTIDGYAALNDQFHDQLAELADNKLIKREVERASQLPFAAPSAFSSNSDDLARFKTSLVVGQQHHHALVQAIERGEGARADALAREHAQLGRANIEIAYLERAENDRAVPQLALVTAEQS
ncbi:MAG: GntR family transcriptional regulator [Granulosicoccaceae bacterium]